MNHFNKNLPYNDLPSLPPQANLETAEIFKLSINANKLLAELKGYCQTLPNPSMLLNTIVLQESKESSAIENIVTTQDELYQATLNFTDTIKNPAAKEVIQYRKAMYWGLDQLDKQSFITSNLLIGVMQQLRNTSEHIRLSPGVKIANTINNEIVYTPPEGENIIRQKLADLEKFINDDSYSDLDPLVKVALIHYQFEAIHPFSDGNGRTGRILNVLYLINKGLLVLPVLYLSRYIIQHKSDYYKFLREVTENGNWHDWVKFILKGIGETSAMTLKKINAILELREQSQPIIKNALKSAYSKEFVDLLFSNPYIKIKILEDNNIAKRQTASEYLRKVEQTGFLRSTKIAKETYYINHQLLEILSK